MASALPISVIKNDSLVMKNVEKPSVPGSTDDSLVKVDFVLIVAIMGLIAVLANLRIFSFVSFEIQMPRKRFVHILIAHQSIIAIVNVLNMIMYNLEKLNLIDWMGPGLCELVSFARWTIASVYPLNVVAVISEHLTTTRIRTKTKKWLVFRSIFSFWFVAIVTSVPRLFMSTYKYKNEEKGEGSCKQIRLLGSGELTLAYELMRFLIFHVMVVAYAACLFCRIRCKFKRLALLQNLSARMREKIQRVDYIYTFVGLFIILWSLFGVNLLVYNLHSRKVLMFQNLKDILTQTNMLYQIYLILNPLIYIFLIEQPDITQFLTLPCPVVIGKVRHHRTGKAPEGIEIVDNVPFDSINPMERALMARRRRRYLSRRIVRPGAMRIRGERIPRPRPRQRQIRTRTRRDNANEMTRASSLGNSSNPSSCELRSMLLTMKMQRVHGAQWQFPRIGVTPPTPV